MFMLQTLHGKLNDLLNSAAVKVKNCSLSDKSTKFGTQVVLVILYDLQMGTT